VTTRCYGPDLLVAVEAAQERQGYETVDGESCDGNGRIIP
jgi:hypothetical protein